MYKSAAIFGAVMFILALGVTLVLPYCVPCAAVLVGLSGGYVAGVFAKPTQQSAGVKGGAIAGVLAGIGAILGEMIGAVINGTVVGPEQAQQFANSLGLQTTVMDTGSYWATTLGINCVVSLVSVALMAGLGALGGLLWWSAVGKKQAAVPVSPYSPPTPPVNF